MTFLTSRFVREKLWAEELLDCIVWYRVATFFVDRVWKTLGFITFEWLNGLQNRLQKGDALLDSNAPPRFWGTTFLYLAVPAMRLDVGFQDRIHAALIAGAGSAEPFQHIRVYPQGYLLLGLLEQGGGWQAAGRFKKRIVQRQVIRIGFGGAGDCLVRHIAQALPVRL